MAVINRSSAQITIFISIALFGWFAIPEFFDWRQKALVPINHSIDIASTYDGKAISFKPVFSGWYSISIDLSADEKIPTIVSGVPYLRFKKSVSKHLPEHIDISVEHDENGTIYSYSGAPDGNSWIISHSNTTLVNSYVSAYFDGNEVRLQNGETYVLNYAMYGGKEIAKDIDAKLILKDYSELYILEEALQYLWVMVCFIVFGIFAIRQMIRNRRNLPISLDCK